MIACWPVGYGVGVIAQRAVNRNIDAYKEAHPLPSDADDSDVALEVAEEAGLDQDEGRDGGAEAGDDQTTTAATAADAAVAAASGSAV